MPTPLPVPTSTPVQEVVVTGARLPDPTGDAAFSIVQVDPAVLAGSARLDEALSSVPGFSLFRRTSSLGANPTTQGVSLRGIAGSGASRALVTLDGVPQNDPFGGWVIWTALPSESIGQASVVRGAGAGPYGAGALTGTVELKERTSVDGGFGADLSGGELGYGRAVGVGETQLGHATLLLDAAGETSDGWIPVRQGRGAADTALDLHDWSSAAKLTSEAGPGTLSARVAAYEEDRGAGTLDTGSRARGAQASLSFAAQPAPDAFGYSLQGWLQVSDLRNLSASVAANRQTATLADDQYATPAVGVGFNAAMRRTSQDASLEFGLDVRNYDGQSRELTYNQGTPTGARVSGGGQTVAGLYAEASRRFGQWLVTGGARLDGWVDYNSRFIQTGNSPLAQVSPDRGGATPTGRLGVRRDLTPDLYARAAVYTGFRPVTLNELHRSFRVGNDVTLANASLSPEQLYGGEIGLGGTRWVTWDADVFYNQLANAVTNVTIGHGPGTFPIAGFVPAGGTLYRRENAGRINATGLEAEASRQIFPHLTLRTAVDYTYARVSGGSQAPQLTGLRPAETPSTTATAGADWRPLTPLTLSAQVRYESARFDDDANTRRIAPGTGVDARAGWRVWNDLELYVAAENLFDADIQTGRSAANVVTYDAPRVVRAGLDLRL
jgi:outer membrane receptor protein involved in Fe transport